MSRKVQRGILGYKKDPRHQVLFSFSPRDGDECPSSDSQDSDYLPSDEERPSTSERKSRKKAVKGHNSVENGLANKKRKAVAQSGHRESKVAKSVDRRDIFVNRDDFQGRLPPEIWLRIFQVVVRMEGALPFLCRAAKVCHMWRELSEHPSLWEVVDLSYGWIRSRDQTLIWLSNHRLSQCHTLSVSSWKNLTNQAIKELSRNCPNLKSINLSYCKKLTSEAVTALVDSCHIEEIDISFISLRRMIHAYSNSAKKLYPRVRDYEENAYKSPKEDVYSIDLKPLQNDAVSVSCLKHLAGVTGRGLRHLTIGGNMLKGFPTVLTTIMNSCPNLELLDVSNAIFSADFVSINIETFQARCPKLRVLRLTNSKFRASSATQRVKAESPGFPNLEQLSLAVSTSGLNSSLGFDDDFISRLLKTSLDLRLLDLRGCTNISTSSLAHSPVTDLLQLHLSQSSIAKYSDLDVVFRKWQHSLTHVDLSWNNNPENLDKGVAALAEGSEPSQLEHLNVAGTSVGINPIKSVLESCSKLTYINLTSCRSLPRGIKREFNGRKKITKLKEEFENVSDSELESLSD